MSTWCRTILLLPMDHNLCVLTYYVVHGCSVVIRHGVPTKPYFSTASLLVLTKIVQRYINDRMVKFMNCCTNSIIWELLMDISHNKVVSHILNIVDLLLYCREIRNYHCLVIQYQTEDDNNAHCSSCFYSIILKVHITPTLSKQCIFCPYHNLRANQA